MALATRAFPVPLAPWSKMLQSTSAILWTSEKSSLTAGLFPTIALRPADNFKASRSRWFSWRMLIRSSAPLVSTRISLSLSGFVA